MFKKLTVHNFQIHEDTELNLDHPIVVLCGKSDSGKSSLLRAVRWLCLNTQPTGVSFAKKGKTEFSAQLEVDDKVILRKRGKSDNEYYLNKSLYKAFGTKVPDDILKVLNVDLLNFSHQLDGPFWFNLTPGQVSKELNSIIQLDVIDTSLSNASSYVKKTKAEVEVCEERLKTARQKKKDLLWVKDVNKRLIKLEETSNEITETNARASRTTLLLESVNKAEIRLENLSEALIASEEVIETFPLDLINKITRLEEILDELGDAEITLNKLIEAEISAQKKLDDNKGVTCSTCGQAISEDHLTKHGV